MRVAIVNDMKMVVEVLKRVIGSISELELVWVAYDGAEAIKKCSQDPPDLILMDLIMPILDGVQATKQIMQTNPCAILIVTATVGGNSSKVFEAMGFGALDVVKTPILDGQLQSLDSRELLAKIERISHLIGKSIKKTNRAKRREEKSKESPFLVLMGASTGGPKALIQILSQLPKPLNFALVIIQHIDEQFAKGFAKWLGQESHTAVKIAEPGMEPETGQVLLAGKNDHLILDKHRKLQYTQEPLGNPYRPSVDVFYWSVADHWGDKGVAILLTGMGSDGAKGMKTLHDLGWHTIAQNRDSSIVFGMPKAAIALGGTSEVLSLLEIGPTLAKLSEQKRST